MIVIGIDPGASGGIAVVEHDGATGDGQVRAYKMGETEADTAAILVPFSGGVRAQVVHAFIERVASRPGQGVSSTFKFGTSYGFVRGLLVAFQIPFEEVSPGVWQKTLGCLSKGDKRVTKARAQQLWPGKTWTHATADAALIAEYGRRVLALRNGTKTGGGE